MKKYKKIKSLAQKLKKVTSKRVELLEELQRIDEQISRLRAKIIMAKQYKDKDK